MLANGAPQRFMFSRAAISFALLCSLIGCSLIALPARADAVSPGGTAPATGSAGAPAAPSGWRVRGRASSQKATSKQASSLHVLTVRITSASCMPAARCTTNAHEVSTHGNLALAGKGLAPGMTVAFPATPGGRIGRSSPYAHLRTTKQGLLLTVPAKAHSGHIMVLLGHGRHTSSYGPITVVRYALHPPVPAKVIPAAPPTATAASGTAFEGQGMWIWYLSASDGGNLAAIVAQAHAADVTTVFVKSSDGSSNYWSQFSPQLVAELHANGLKVCAWQFVYGTNPAGEANLGAEAVANGADCLVIDAEGEYEGRYGSAQTYIADLRTRVGVTYPLGLASFPYVYDHTSFPYSVFLGPNGAQFNAPQMYWKDIGNSVDTAYANTYISNRVYGRPIYPLGQTYSHPSNSELVRFREEAVDYGATGLSWWDWQETPASEWTALAEPLAPLTSVTPDPGWRAARPSARLTPTSVPPRPNLARSSRPFFAADATAAGGLRSGPLTCPSSATPACAPPRRPCRS